MTVGGEGKGGWEWGGGGVCDCGLITANRRWSHPTKIAATFNSNDRLRPTGCCVLTAVCAVVSSRHVSPKIERFICFDVLVC